MVAAAEAGSGAAVVVRGEAGIGKTALLNAASEIARGFTCLRARGRESESSLGFAGLGDLLRPLAGHLDALPDPQAAALAGALALGPPAPGDRLAVSVATFGLLEAAAREAPVLVLVDDIHWLDPPSRDCVLFAAHRARGRIGVVVAERERPGEPPVATDLPEIVVPPLGSDDARDLLERVAGDLDPAVRDEIAQAADGNPLALHELPGSLSEEQRRGDAPLERPLAPGGTLERLFAGRLAALPDATRTALLVAAASGSDDLRAIAAGCGGLGCGAADLEAAEDAGLVRIDGGRIAFTHPLAQGAAYHGAAASERRAAHRALAAVVADDSRAWHLAAAAVGPDDEAAAALDAVAQGAGMRRAYATAADALERAAELSGDPDAGAARSVGAGAAAMAAGRTGQALRVLTAAKERVTNPRLRVEAEHLHGAVTLWNGGVLEAIEELEGAGERVAADDPLKAALMLADAAVGCTVSAEPRRALALSQRAHGLLGDAGDPAARAQVLGILAWSLTLCGRAPKARAIYEELDRLATSIDPFSPAASSLMLAVNTRHATGEFERAHAEALALVAVTREAGALFAMAMPLIVVCDAAFRLGRWDGLDDMLAEAMAVGAATGQRTASAHSAVTRARLAAAQGRSDLARSLAQDALEYCDATGARSGKVFAHAALGFLELGLGQANAAIAHLEEVERLTAGHGMDDPGLVPWAPDLVEAYARVGRRADAERAAAEFARRGERAESRYGMAAAERCLGLLEEDDFDAHFARAMEFHDGLPMPFERGRTLLAWGARLHRARRRGEAREQLRAAQQLFTELGATAWADVAAGELRAAGGRRRSAAPAEALTAQQLRVARAAASGATTREIAAELFLSPKTVEFHLGQTYRKLGIRTRAALAARLPDLSD